MSHGLNNIIPTDLKGCTRYKHRNITALSVSAGKKCAVCSVFVAFFYCGKKEINTKCQKNNARQKYNRKDAPGFSSPYNNDLTYNPVIAWHSWWSMWQGTGEKYVRYTQKEQKEEEVKNPRNDRLLQQRNLRHNKWMSLWFSDIMNDRL